MSELRFSSVDKALQHLSNLTGRKVLISNNYLKDVLHFERDNSKFILTTGIEIKGTQTNFQEMRGYMERVENSEKINQTLIKEKIPGIKEIEEIESYVQFVDGVIRIAQEISISVDDEININDVENKLLELGV